MTTMLMRVKNNNRLRQRCYSQRAWRWKTIEWQHFFLRVHLISMFFVH